MLIYRSTRLQHRGDAFDHRLDTVIAPVLLRQGFSETEPYCFRKSVDGGREVVYFNVTPEFFVVHVGFMPDYMREIDALYDYYEGEPVVGISGRLTPRGVFMRTSTTFGCKHAADRDKSMAVVAASLEAYGFSWLQERHDPAVYAADIPRDALVYFARAHEEAGDVEAALGAYYEQLRRECAVKAQVGSVGEFSRTEGNRVFVYLCLKLQAELDTCREVQALTGYRPLVTPLDSR